VGRRASSSFDDHECVHARFEKSLPSGGFGSTRAIDFSLNTDLEKPRREVRVFLTPISGSSLKEMEQ
jgi:hypothetical protein